MAGKEDTLEKKAKKQKKKKEITIKANKKGRHILPFMNFVRVLFIPFYFLVKPFRFFGKRKVGDGAHIYISNHRTMLDIVYPAVTTWEALHYVPKKEVEKMPVVGWLARVFKAIPVNRDGNDVRALLDCMKCLKNGEKIVIYPEGTRNKTQDVLLPFKPGAAVMAIRTKTPIVPIMIYTKPKFFRCTHVLIGEPFELVEYYDRKLTDEEIAQADEKLRNTLLEMHAAHTQYLQDKKRKKGKKGKNA